MVCQQEGGFRILDETTVRQIAEGLYQAQSRPDPRQIRLDALEKENRVYLELQERQGNNTGWLVWKDPKHRWDEQAIGTTAEVMREVTDFPLTNKIITYKGMEWLLYRPLNTLSDEELDSDPKYRKAYEVQVARGIIKPRPARVTTTAP